MVFDETCGLEHTMLDGSSQPYHTELEEVSNVLCCLEYLEGHTEDIEFTGACETKYVDHVYDGEVCNADHLALYPDRSEEDAVTIENSVERPKSECCQIGIDENDSTMIAACEREEDWTYTEADGVNSLPVCERTTKVLRPDGAILSEETDSNLTQEDCCA